MELDAHNLEIPFWLNFLFFANSSMYLTTKVICQVTIAFIFHSLTNNSISKTCSWACTIIWRTQHLNPCRIFELFDHNDVFLYDSYPLRVLRRTLTSIQRPPAEALSLLKRVQTIKFSRWQFQIYPLAKVTYLRGGSSFLLDAALHHNW